MRRLGLAVALLLVLGSAPSWTAGPAIPPNAGAQAVDRISMTVENMDRSIAFFTDVLTFEKVSEVEVSGSDYERLEGVFGLRMRVVGLRLGEERLELREFLTPKGRPVPVDSKSNDRWFQHVAIIVSDMDRAYARLREHRVTYASPWPQRLPDWNKNAGGIEAFYFKDPDGHPLEVLHFPSDKGDARWRRPTDRLFLGLDHTAIVVADTEASLRFYRDALGMRVAGESENYGIEQERLNNVFGARLRITGLRTPVGPGVEFLEYLAPRNGRPMPADVQGNDLVNWQTHITTGRLQPALSRLLTGTFAFVSPGAVRLQDDSIGFPEAATLRDPDGHEVVLAERAIP